MKTQEIPEKVETNLETIDLEDYFQFVFVFHNKV